MQFRQSAIQSAGPRVSREAYRGAGKGRFWITHVISLLIVPSSS